MSQETFWTDLRREIQSESVVSHPIYTDLVKGRLKKGTIAELCAQLKHTVEEGISSLSLIIPQVTRETRRELSENLFGELAGTPEVPSHWELAIRAGAAAGFTEEDIDSRPMLPETKVYPDTVSAYAMRGLWLEALSFVSMGIEDMFTKFCDGVTRGLKAHYGYDDAQAFYFAVHVGADEVHAETGWKTAIAHATTDEKRESVRLAALEGRNMWWNMYSAVYKQGEGKEAPVLRFEV
ncbi:MAG: iron-containing redox enzyme family protein [Chloroflexi bacterium]|nr:iron-containing redox enzyme family protein [Chloroflexota bacterium]